MRYIIIILFSSSIIAASCRHVNVYEKQVDLPNHEWKKSQRAILQFNITDSAQHRLFLVLRHTHQFEFNKLLLSLSIQDTAKHVLTAMQITAPLTDSSGAWSGTAMDDVYYARIKIDSTVFLRPGLYRFVLQHAMKEKTIPYLLNVGIALDQ